MIPKSDTATYQDILQSIEAAAQAAVGTKWNGVRPPVLPQPLHDGDGVRESGEPFRPECCGHWVITASSQNKPEVVHVSNIESPLAPQDIYSGMRARVTINFFGYNSNGKRGVGCGLGNVLKTRDDEPLAGGASAAVDFAGIAAAAPAYPTQSYVPQPPAQPYAPPTQAYAPQYAAPPAYPTQQIHPITGLPYTS